MAATFEGPLALGGKPLALHAFVVGYEPMRESMSIDGGDPLRHLLEPVTAVAVEYTDGWVLLDTGFNVAVVRDPERRREVFNYDSYTAVVPLGDPLLDAVAGAGFEWSDLAACAISHAHLDHTGGIAHVPDGVPVILQRRELEWLASGAGIRDVVLPSDVLDAGEDLRAIDGETVLAPGLTALDTHGHTPGHQSFRVDLVSGRSIVLACDAADLIENLETQRRCSVVPVPGAERAAQEAVETLARWRREGLEVWPGHDPHWWPWAAAMRGEAVRVD
ncbi:N-acyl homoserine lactonase family protein [Demequina gelatinilytica]|uniref:N-acyl homoserine lactonase family protein n=1 Tax=Demequina gelatinilytica TaxID=1638980 RepID=UPI000782971D|nr:N-acyl homoserine lactonase family protein [Demequina gelatinilytica]